MRSSESVVDRHVAPPVSYWQAESPQEIRVPVARPRLPAFPQVAPYLQRIDETRWYSNGGPLVREFEKRLAVHAGGGGAQVATVANATVGLTLALLAGNPPVGSFCLLPSWTFAASAHAISLAGLTPWLVDVERESGALSPALVRSVLPAAPGPVAAVMPVSPFGAPLDPRPWESLRAETGLAVVLDAAAAFDSVRASAVPTVVSLHATKALGTGEGGFVLSTDQSFIQEIEQRANFGFWNSREARALSCNGKMSEYAAAVGLAGLDAWPETQNDFARVAQTYRRKLGGQDVMRLQDGFGARWIASTVIIDSRRANADPIAQTLAARGFGSRRWWGGGLHRQAAFMALPRTDLPATEALADSVLGLPCWRDLPETAIAQICDLLLSC